MSTHSALQGQFLQSLKEKDAAVVNGDLSQRFLFADVVHCLNGDFSTGGTTTDDGVNIPMLHVSFEDANEAHLEADKDFQESREGEDDFGDVYEGEVMAVRWRSDDILEFFLVHEDGTLLEDALIGTCSVKRAMGE